MLKKYIYITLLIISGLAISQPGFMGKKNWLEGNLLVFSALRSPTATKTHDDGFYKNAFHLNKTLVFTYHRVVDRKRAIGVEINYDATGFYWQPSLNGNIVNMYADEGEVPDLKVRTKMIGISYLKYANKLGNIAPFGFYTEWEALYSNSTVYDAKFDDNLQTFNLGYLGFGLGVRNIIAKRFTLNLGIKTRLSSYILEALQGATNEEKASYLHQAKLRVTSKQLFNVAIGLGYIF